MFDEASFIIAVYLLICQSYRELFPNGVRQRGIPPSLSDEEALTIAIVGEYLQLERDKAIYEYFAKHYRAWFPGLKDRTLLVKQWANLWQVEQSIWQALVQKSGANGSSIQIIDTLPVPVCHLRRYKGRQIMPEDDGVITADVGYCASKDLYYFGVKGGIRIASNGMIVHAPLLEARPHDSQHTEALLAGTPAGTIGLGDKGFIEAEAQARYEATYELRLLTPLRQGMHDYGFTMPNSLTPLRQLIETVNAQLVERFHVQSMRVRKGWTLAAKWYRKILAHTVCVWLNLTLNQPPLNFAGLVCVK